MQLMMYSLLIYSHFGGKQVKGSFIISRALFCRESAKFRGSFWQEMPDFAEIYIHLLAT